VRPPCFREEKIVKTVRVVVGGPDNEPGFEVAIEGDSRSYVGGDLPTALGILFRQQWDAFGDPPFSIEIVMAPAPDAVEVVVESDRPVPAHGEMDWVHLG